MTEQSPAEAIFFAALEKGTAEERSAYLQAACGHDSDLRRRVDRLLAAHPQVGSFLEAAAQGELGADESPMIPLGEKCAAGPGLSQTTSYYGPNEGVGSVVAGRYKLLETLGEGGMGAVFMAQQTAPVKRVVALKLIKPGMDSRQVLTRFEAERQALALMDHPNVAKVLDAGATDSGRPFFVMELVRGVPITRFCDERQLSPRERLELFIPVCQAIQHAHQKGVIHRDIKPTNVLVALYDDRPVPKVIDFGVAKAAGFQLTDASLVTGFGAIVGTPEYMSPEQAQLNQLDIDTRSDVYALGVLLYELLTGTTPINRKRLGQDALLEILRVIREEEPARPSTRLSTSETLVSIAAPAKLARLMRGELDWIVMKCLEKDRSRRYETANGLARDLEHYLHDEPVLACPPSAGYRLKKLARRHTKAVATASAFVLLLLLGTLVSGWQAIRATAAEREARKAQGLADLDRDRALKAEAQAKADRDKAEDERKHSHQNELYYNGMLWMEWGDYDSAEKLFVASLGLARSRRGLGDVETQRIVWALAGLYVQMKTPEKGESLLRELLDFQKQHGQADSLPLPYATTLEFLARNLLQQRKWAAAEALLRECLSIRENKEPLMMSNRFSTKSLLGASLVGQEKYADAEPYLLQGYQGLADAAKNYPGLGPIPVPDAAERLVQLYVATGKKDKADEWRTKLEEAKDTGKPALAP
jgi:serine/threonine protein kinase